MGKEIYRRSRNPLFFLSLFELKPLMISFPSDYKRWLTTPILSFFFLLWSSTCLLSQTTVSGVVLDAQNNEPLSFVHISVNDGETGTISDLDGTFDWKTEREVKNIRFSYVGYHPVSLNATDLTDFSDLVVRMQRKPQDFDEIVVYAGENPAHRLIRGVFDNRQRHRPENYPSFRYLAYNKMWVAVDFDSTTLAKAQTEPDTSSLNSAIDFFTSQHLFMSESVVERVFRKPSRNREEVLATRTSGFENPLFVLIGTELQSFSFYESEFQLAGINYKSPISRQSERYYEFHMRDTILHQQPTDTTYVVAYYPVEGRNFPALKGLLYIRVPDFAIENVIAGPSFRRTTNLGSPGPDPLEIDISIRQQYRKTEGDHWFPTQLNTDFRLNMFQMDPDLKGSDLVLNVRTYLDSIEVGLPNERTRMGPVDVLLNPNAGQRDDQFWDDHRHTPLDTVDMKTYIVLDSIGQEYKFDQRMDWLTQLISGRLKLGRIDLMLNRLLRINYFEGIRLGAGFRTNHDFSRHFDVGAWYGYGFRDKNHKYGADLGWMISTNYQIKWSLGYERELEETGGTSFFFERSGGWFHNQIRPFFITNYGLSNRWFSAVEFHPRANLKSRLSLNFEHRELLGDYRFTPGDEPDGQHDFHLSYLRFDLSFAPGDRYFQGHRGRQNLNYTYPRFYFSYQGGLRDLYKGQLEFTRLAASVSWAHSMPAFGRFSAELTGGALLGSELPYFLLFTGRHNFLDRSGFFNRIIIADRKAFETMRPEEFHSDRYAMLLLRYDFSSLLFSPDILKAPHLEIVLRGLWGDSDVDESLHSGIALKAPSRVFMESGIEVNNIYRFMGVGVYYRMGHYRLPSFSGNLAIRFTSKYVF